MGTIGLDWQASGVGNFSSITAFRISTGVTLRAALAKEDAPMQARGEKPPSRIIDFDALSDRGGHRLARKNKSLAWTNKSSDVGKATKGCLALPVTQSGRGRTVQRSALLTGPGQQTAGASSPSTGQSCFSHWGMALCMSFRSQQSLQRLQL